MAQIQGLYGDNMRISEQNLFLINVAGRSKVKVMDGLGNETVFCLNRPHTGHLPSKDDMEGNV